MDVAPVVQQSLVEVIDIDVDIAPTDPLLAYLQHASNPVELARLNLQSPALEELRAADVAVVIPLVSQGELIGIVNLGQRLSEQEYSTDDRKLLNDLSPNGLRNKNPTGIIAPLKLLDFAFT